MLKLNKEQDAQLEEMRGKMSDLATMLETAADEADAYFDEKSEKWQESDRGTAYNDWKDNLRTAADAISEARDACENVSAEPTF